MKDASGHDRGEKPKAMENLTQTVLAELVEALLEGDLKQKPMLPGFKILANDEDVE